MPHHLSLSESTFITLSPITFDQLWNLYARWIARRQNYIIEKFPIPASLDALLITLEDTPWQAKTISPAPGVVNMLNLVRDLKRHFFRISPFPATLSLRLPVLSGLSSSLFPLLDAQISHIDFLGLAYHKYVLTGITVSQLTWPSPSTFMLEVSSDTGGRTFPIDGKNRYHGFVSHVDLAQVLPVIVSSLKSAQGLELKVIDPLPFHTDFPYKEFLVPQSFDVNSTPYKLSIRHANWSKPLPSDSLMRFEVSFHIICIGKRCDVSLTERRDL